MKQLMKVALAIGLAILAFAGRANAQTYSVSLTGAGSSGLFLSLGQAADYGLGCLWTSPSTVTVEATDTTTGTSLNDSGSAWVAWSKGASGSCTSFASTDTIKIEAYLSTDSVVGDRCLFNATNYTSPECVIHTYPTTSTGTAPGYQIYPSTGTCGTSSGSAAGECTLPGAIGTALNSATVNFAGTDIRPEDAEFAITRATTACGTEIGSTQYYGLGYSNGSTIKSQFSTSAFNVIEFTLPTSGGANSYSVATVGASPVVVVVDGTSWPYSTPASLNITNHNLAKFLDGSYYTTGQISSTAVSGGYVDTIIREPLSGTYNTMEYNVPNSVTNSSTYSLNGDYTGNDTSQDVGQAQPASQVNCASNTSLISGSTTNPMHILASTAGGERDRAIGTGQELSEVLSVVAANSSANTLGYGFWTVPNFKGYTSTAAPDARYLEVDGVDPLSCSGTQPGSTTACTAFNGIVPTTTAELANVDLHNVASGKYPIWSLLRLVTITSNTTATSAASTLSSNAQEFVPAGVAPNFVAIKNMTVVRSHFTPPAELSGSAYPTTNVNGDKALGTYSEGVGTTFCTATPEAGGDVGGLIIALTTDSTACHTNAITTGVTAQRQ